MDKYEPPHVGDPSPSVLRLALLIILLKLCRSRALEK